MNVKRQWQVATSKTRSDNPRIKQPCLSDYNTDVMELGVVV